MSKITWNIIPPEIKNDEFYNQIIQLLQKSDNIETVLEIGASSGDGSTEAFQIGKRDKNIKLFSIEVCTERFQLLKKRYASDANFFPYNISSIGIDEFPEKQVIIDFYNTNRTNLNHYPLPMVLEWYDKDIDYIKSNQIPQNGIEHIKKEHNINTFDCVLIDGSEFTGMIEYHHIKVAKYILLDDINAFKTYSVNIALKMDPKYECLFENYQVRNGFAIFKRI